MFRKVWLIAPLSLLFRGYRLGAGFAPFHLSLWFTVKNVSAGEKVRIWIPQPTPTLFRR